MAIHSGTLICLTLRNSNLNYSARPNNSCGGLV